MFFSSTTVQTSVCYMSEVVLPFFACCVFIEIYTHLTYIKCFTAGDESYLVDPASSHMLVSKIKPCMSKYKHLYTVKLRTAHYISYDLFDGTLLHG